MVYQRVVYFTNRSQNIQFLYIIHFVRIKLDCNCVDFNFIYVYNDKKQVLYNTILSFEEVLIFM